MRRLVESAAADGKLRANEVAAPTARGSGRQRRRRAGAAKARNSGVRAGAAKARNSGVRAGAAKARNSGVLSAQQLPLRFSPARDGSMRGGARVGAGRKRVEGRSSTPHRARPPHRASEPVHVTLRAALAPLRSQHVFPTVRIAILRANRRAPQRFRIVQFSVQRDHVHLIVEANDKRALSAGVRSVSIRIARYVNDLLLRRGRLWADRWFGRALRSPREVRYALGYVLTNFRKHARTPLGPGIDPYSSGGWFDGWREWRPGLGRPPRFAGRSPPGVALAPGIAPALSITARGVELFERPSLPARRWLTTTGWRRCGLIGIGEAPAG
jgi:REP element-mobilizing transposase RayT